MKFFYIIVAALLIYGGISELAHGSNAAGVGALTLGAVVGSIAIVVDRVQALMARVAALEAASAHAEPQPSKGKRSVSAHTAETR